MKTRNYLFSAQKCDILFTFLVNEVKRTRLGNGVTFRVQP